MKIKNIIQAPTGTIVQFYENTPKFKLGDFIECKGEMHEIKGFEMGFFDNVFISKTDKLKVDDEINFINN